jgi:2-dehydropantoate 2-reductase
MRFVIYGVGAIGGTFAAALSTAGHPVVGIARGKMLDAIRTNGLLFRTPAGDTRIPLQVVETPAEIAFEPGDVVLLTMKSQDTAEALAALRAAGLRDQPVICAQNGINNERLALRLFPATYTMTVLIPADYITPGEVACYARPRHGILDLGRYPAGLDDTVTALAAAFESANFAVFPMPQVMHSKHGKLLENLVNVIEAALGPGVRAPEIYAAVRVEGEAVYRAAGITEWLEIGGNEQRRVGVLEMGQIPGLSRDGGSSTQSLKRGAGSIETDYLNGEIVLLGRLHGVPTPLNAALCALSQELIDSGAGPGSLTPADLKRRLGLA